MRNLKIHLFYAYWTLLLLVLTNSWINATQSEQIILKNDLWTISISPFSLELTAQPKDYNEFFLSSSQNGLGSPQNMKNTETEAKWELPDKGISVAMELNESDLSVQFRTSKHGEFTWPIVSKTQTLKALIWPRWEGCYIPLDDKRWTDYLIDSGKWNSLEGISMPFWGLDCGDYILTYIITNPYNNEIRFISFNSKF